MQKTLLQTNNIFFESDAHSLLEGITLSLLRGDRIALIGKNGSGKSTLLKILAGLLQPTKGSIHASGLTYYLPQFDLELLQKEQSLYDYLSGECEEWWQVLLVLEKYFAMPNVDAAKLLKDFSGGEVVKIHLAIALVLSPDILLLDEPTNHLDLQSQDILKGILEEFVGAYIIVTHNEFFLHAVARKVWEIEERKVTVWGGSYAQYLEERQRLLDAKTRQYEVKKKEMKKVKESIAREEIRAARSKRIGREVKSGRSMDRFATSYFGNKASASAGDNKQKLTGLLADKKQDMEVLKVSVSRPAVLSLHAGKRGKNTLLKIAEGLLHIGESGISIEGISLTLTYGDRVLFSGKNGSGKSSLIKGILQNDKDIFLDGEVYMAADMKAMYLSQKYEIVKPELSVMENMLRVSTTISYEEVRKQLGNMLFFGKENIEKKAAVLSGGEIARLAFAMITVSPIDLLILDEPTNNLDIQTVNAITTSLQEFQGSIIVISHDIEFLHAIGIETAYLLYEGKFLSLATSPMEKEAFYAELLKYT